jgi:hypothetical protein
MAAPGYAPSATPMTTATVQLALTFVFAMHQLASL